MFRILLVFVGLVCCSVTTQAQLPLSDSLYKALPNSLKPAQKVRPADQEIIRILEKSYWPFIYRFADEFDVLAQRLQKQFPSIKKDTERMTYTHALANFYSMSNNVPKAMFWHKLVIAEGEAEGKKVHRNLLGDSYLTMGIFLCKLEKQDSAVDMIQKATDVAIAAHDTSTLNYTYYARIPLYNSLELYPQALYYANKFLDSQPIKWTSTYTEIVNAKGLIYTYMFRESKKTVYADSAARLIKSVMTATKKDQNYWYGICYTYLALIEYYRGDYKKAIMHCDSAFLPRYTQKGAFISYWSHRFKLYRALSMIQTGQRASIADLLAIDIPPKDFVIRQELHSVLSKYFSKQGNYQKALEHYTLYRAYEDSTDLIGQKGKVFEATQKYSVAQKEAAIAVLQTKNLQAQVTRNRIVVTAIIVVLLLAILALLLYLRTKRQQTQRLVERQKLTDELQLMEQEMELERLNQQVEQALAIANQRKTISQNMHDEVSSSLVTLRYRVADMKRTTPIDATREALDDIEDELNAIYLQTRDLLHRLADKTSQKTYNVFDLLEQLAQRFGTGNGLQVQVEADRELNDKLTPQQNAELYRVVKEAVANSMKHSGASRIRISLYCQKGNVLFSIQDNGRGVSVEKGSGLGLSAMQQRLESLKGKLWIEPSTAGMDINGSFPMHAS